MKTDNKKKKNESLEVTNENRKMNETLENNFKKNKENTLNL